MSDLNRQQKRMAKKQGFVDEQGDPVRERRQTRNQPRPGEERVGPTQFLREVRGELRKVSWPRREEVVNYSIVVLVVLVLLTTAIGLLDWGFSEAILKLFDR